MYPSTFGSCASKSNSAFSNKESSLAIPCIVNPFRFSVIVLVSLHPFSGPPVSFRSSFVSSSCCTASSMKLSSCTSSPGFLLRTVKLLKTFWTPHPSCQTHENREQTMSKDSPKPIHGDGCNLTPSKVNVFMEL